MAVGDHADARFPRGFNSQFEFFRGRRERIARGATDAAGRSDSDTVRGAAAAALFFGGVAATDAAFRAAAGDLAPAAGATIRRRRFRRTRHDRARIRIVIGLRIHVRDAAPAPRRKPSAGRKNRNEPKNQRRRHPFPRLLLQIVHPHIHRRVIVGHQRIFRNQSVFIQPQIARHGPNKSARKDAARQLIPLFVLQRLKKFGIDAGSDGNFDKGNAS